MILNIFLLYINISLYMVININSKYSDMNESWQKFPVLDKIGMILILPLFYKFVLNIIKKEEKINE